MVYNFKTITLKDMMAYIEANAPQDKEWFKEQAYEMRGKRIAVPQFDKNGNPIMKTDKNGKVKQVTKMVEEEGSEKTRVFSLFKAKFAFANRYMPEIVPKANKAKKPSDLLKDW